MFDYPLKQAIIDNIVKRPLKGVAKGIAEQPSEMASTRYQAYLAAGVERWKEYREQLAPLGRKPVLFVMMNDTAEADDVGDWLQKKYPAEFGGDRLLIIHTNRSGEVAVKDLDEARTVARDVDSGTSPVNCIVSVVMLREGWDVQSVTVIVGLRPYTAKAAILPEQTVGRGLRLMFRDDRNGYVERVDVIGNRKFIEFVEQLETRRRPATGRVRDRQGQGVHRHHRADGGRSGQGHSLAAAESDPGAQEVAGGRDRRPGRDGASPVRSCRARKATRRRGSSSYEAHDLRDAARS